VFDVRARGAAGEWRAPRMALKREGARASVGESIEWLRSPRSTKTVAAKRPNFKVGASLALPVVDDGEQWDGEAASAGVFEASGLNTPWSDGFLARKAHLVYDASAPHLKSSYRFLFARIIDGVLTADREGLNLDELGDEVEPLTLSEPRQSLALRFDPQTGSPLLVGADTDVSDDRLDGGLDCVLILYKLPFWCGFCQSTGSSRSIFSARYRSISAVDCLSGGRLRSAKRRMISACRAGGMIP
jgi:hypothetical protein